MYLVTKEVSTARVLEVDPSESLYGRVPENWVLWAFKKGGGGGEREGM